MSCTPYLIAVVYLTHKYETSVRYKALYDWSRESSFKDMISAQYNYISIWPLYKHNRESMSNGDCWGVVRLTVKNLYFSSHCLLYSSQNKKQLKIILGEGLGSYSGHRNHSCLAITLTIQRQCLLKIWAKAGLNILRIHINEPTPAALSRSLV